MIIQLLFLYIPAHGFEAIIQDGICPQDEKGHAECNDLFENNTNLLPDLNGEKGLTGNSQKSESKPIKDPLKIEVQQTPQAKHKFTVYFFWGEGCPHCETEKIFLSNMKNKHQDQDIEIKDFEVWYNRQNAELLLKMARAYNLEASGVPITFIDKNAFIGFSEYTKKEIIKSIQKCLYSECIDPASLISGELSVDEVPEVTASPADQTEELECKEKSRTVHIPWIGNLEVSEMSLPAITIVIAGLDSFNPCAFFVLFALLGLLIHAKSRVKMLIIGGVFVFFSGFIYFIFMAAWLNLFLLMGQVAIITTGAGIIAIIIAAVNIKDFFIFKKGISLTIPESAKPKLFDRMRKLLKSTSYVSILAGTAILAIAANSYELLCTAGFPMVFTRILTLNNLSNSHYYMYLILYNVIYVIPLLIIVVIFTLTLGKKTLTEWQGKVLKLVSGTMMLGLGGILLFDPAILNNAFVAFLLLLGAIIVSALAAFITKKVKYSA
ncbi:MAG: hypothetical protein IBX72_12120 [Nitrospirae bacterium]|nr:hypothetical protein [Nitrospirota bacterium]